MKRDYDFISTKFKIPIPRKNYIKRETLMESLKKISNNKVTLITGCAASGKTTLVTSFIEEYNPMPVKWLSLDEEDNNIFIFWKCFLEAVKDFLGKDSDEILNYFDSFMDEKHIKGLLIIIINQLLKAEEFILVIDDFHNISDKNILDSIDYFIKYFPENVHMVIITRENTSLYFGDILMEGSFLEIDEKQLRLSINEQKNFLNKTLNISLGQEFINKIDEISEGWIGGIQLLALVINSGKKYILEGTNILNKYMIEFISKEILDSLSDDERNFLINTSFLNYFNGDIADKLLKKFNSEDMIRNLLNKNMFLINIDNENYRYHNIFKKFLNTEFLKNNKYKIRNMHLAAVEIFTDIGDFSEGIYHLLYIKEYEKALELIQVNGQNPKGWMYLSKIPIEVIINNREMLFQRIFYDFCNMNLKQCRDTLETVTNKIQDPISLKILMYARAFAMDEEVSILSLDPLTIEEIRDLDKLSEVTRAIIYINTSVFLRVNKEYSQVSKFLDEAIRIEKNIENIYIKFFALSIKAQVKEDMGDINDCFKIYKDIFSMMDKYNFLYPLKVNVYIGIVGIYLKINELSIAEKYLNKSRVIIDECNISVEWGYKWNLMELKILQNKRNEASAIIDELMGYYSNNDVIYILSLMKYSIIIDEHYKYDVDKIIQYFYDNINKIKMPIDEKITYCRLLFIKNYRQKALDTINEILKFSRKNRMKLQLINGILLKIFILNGEFEKNKREIFNLMREAVYYSFENNIIFPFIFEKSIVEKVMPIFLLERKNELKEREKIFIQDKLHFNIESKDNKILSKRELEVILEISKGLSNKEIADTLCISLSTVKTHIINIYSKLQVNSRITAVEKAREINII